MALQRGTKRYQHEETGEVRYFKTPPSSLWFKVGTKGSKDWRWINNTVEERFVLKTEPIPEGFQLGRIKT